MSLELNLRFPDPGHLFASLDGREVGPFDFGCRIAAAEREEIRWYLETYAASYTTDADDADARRIEAKLPQWGTALFDAAFHHEAAHYLFTLLQTDRTNGDRLITITAQHPTILSLPWELLRDPDGVYLFQKTPRISIRRTVAVVGGGRESGLVTKQRLRVLFVTCRPLDAGFIDPRGEPRAVMDAVEQRAPGRIEIEFLRPATLRKLAERLANKSLPSIDVIHFDGHGAFDAKGDFGDGVPNTGYLLFERESGLKQFVSPDFWHEKIGDRGVSIVVLSACQSAAIADSVNDDPTSEPMGSVACGLMAFGVPAVLAMTHSLLVETAGQLFGEFYRQLAQGKAIGAALDDARLRLMENPEKHEVQRGTDRVRLIVQDWFLPALYEQGQDVPLLDPSVRVGPSAPTDFESAIHTGFTEGTTGRFCNLPDLPEAGFFGRQRELWNIERWFVEGTQRISIVGFGGQGKTFLAAEAGRWLWRTGMFERIVFVSYAAFQGVDALAHAVATLGTVLGESLPDAEAALVALQQTTTLVILDSLEDVMPIPLAELLSTAAKWSEATACRVLLTSRAPDFHHAAYPLGGSLASRVLTLEGLGEEDALGLFQSLMRLEPPPTFPPPERDALLELFRMVSFHPLSIRLLAAQLKTRRAAELGLRLESLMAARGDDKDKCLRASLELSLDRLDEQSRQSLRRMGVLHGGGMELGLMLITTARLRDIQFHGTNPMQLLGNVTIGGERWTNMRGQLQAAGLITLESLRGVGIPYVRFHPTLAPLLWSQLSDEERNELTVKHRLWYYQLSRELYGQDVKHPHEIRAIARLELPNLMQAARGALEAGEEWAVRFSHNVVHFLRLFRLNKDAAALTECEAAMRQTMPTNPTELIPPHLMGFVSHESRTQRDYRVKSNRAQQLLQGGDIKTAFLVFQELLGELGDSPSFERCEILDWLGRCYDDLGQLGRAEALFREALAVVDVLEETDAVSRHLVLMGQPHRVKRQRCLVQTDLGNVLTQVGRYEEARAAYYSAETVAKELGDVASQAVVMSLLGGLALEEGHLREAAARYREVLSLYQGVHQLEAEAVAWHQLGVVYQQSRQWDDAERCFRDAARITESRGDLVRTAGTWDQLAQLSGIAGKFEAAEAWYHKALRVRRQLDDVVGLATTLTNFASFLTRQPGRLDEARHLAEESLAIRRSLALDSPVAGIWTTCAVLATIAREQNNRAQEREYLCEARTTWRSFPGNRRRLEQHGPLIAAVIETVFDPEIRPESEPVLTAMEKQGRVELVSAIRRILDGQRDVDVLSECSQMMDSVIVETILKSIEKPENRRSVKD